MRLVCPVLVTALMACGPSVGPADAGPSLSPNLARNGSFEAPDSGTEFKSLNQNATVGLTAGRTGKALKLTTSSGLYGNSFGSEWKVVAPAPGTYCLVTWMTSSSTATIVRLLRFSPSTGNGENLDFTMPGPLTTWTKVPPNVKHSATLATGDELSVVISDRTATANTVIEIDDLDLWLSADGRCEDARP